MALEEDFLRRWSRRKHAATTEAATQAARPPAAAPSTGEEAPALPPLDTLTPESDFSAFMGAKVADGVKRAALKKLFADPHFNVMDGLDVYIDDYSADLPIPPEMLASLEHAKSTLFGPQPAPDEAGARAEPDAAAPAEEADAPERADGADRPVAAHEPHEPPRGNA